MSLRAFLAENSRWLAAGMLLTFCSGFGQTYFISIFAGAIRDEFGIGHGAWGGIYTAGTLGSAAVMLWAGGLADRFRVRALGAGVLIWLAAACVAMAALPSVWLLVPAIFALRLAGQGMAVHVAMVGMARWFVARRGRAVAIASLGVSAGEALLPLGFVALMSVLPWRALWLVAACVPLAALPLLIRLLRVERTPQSFAADESRAGMGGRHWTRAEMLRHPLFWTIMPLMLSPAAFVTVLFFHQVHLANVKGWVLAEFVALFPLYTSVTVGTMLLAGGVIDRLGTARLIPFYQLPMAGGFLWLSQATTIPGAAVAMAAVALSVGVHIAVVQVLWAERYGTRNLGAIKATATAVTVLGTALGPGISGVLIDAGLAFPGQMGGIAAYILGAGLLATAGLRLSVQPRRARSQT